MIVEFRGIEERSSSRADSLMVGRDFISPSFVRYQTLRRHGSEKGTRLADHWDGSHYERPRFRFRPDEIGLHNFGGIEELEIRESGLLEAVGPARLQLSVKLGLYDSAFSQARILEIVRSVSGVGGDSYEYQRFVNVGKPPGIVNFFTVVESGYLVSSSGANHSYEKVDSVARVGEIAAKRTDRAISAARISMQVLVDDQLDLQQLLEEATHLSG